MTSPGTSALVVLVLAFGTAYADDGLAERANEAYQAQDWSAALALYRDAVNAAPGDGRAWYRLAVSARHVGDAAAANVALDQAGAAGVPATFTELERARLLAAGDDRAGALAALDKALAAGFSNADALGSDAALAALATSDEFAARVAQARANQTPCEGREAFHHFDFWVGEWDVRDAGGNVAGKNRITRVEGGCYLYEQWTGAGGGTGSSMNYYDAARGKWVQHWISQGGTQIQIEGGLDDGSMVLVGRIYNLSSGQQADFRGRWTPLEDGRVRQFFEQSVDGGATWTPWFEGFYSRAK